MEGGFRFEMGRSSELPEILSETIRNPELVFTSSLADAQTEHELVQQTLDGLSDRTRHLESSDLLIEQGLGSHHPRIAVRWNKQNDTATQLVLHPISGGNGPEAGILGYYGTYDLLETDKQSGMQVLSQSIPLERLFGAPRNVRFTIKPTLTRWAVGKDEMSILLGNENVWILYTGLGFLFLGEPWMLIGFHEAGHIPNNHGGDRVTMRGENEAWSVGKRTYAALHHGKERGVGLFDLLQKPQLHYGRNLFADTNPTIGDIERYGITSHAMDPSVKLPFQWSGKDFSKAIETMNTFQQIIKKAQRAYENLSFV